MMMQDSANYPEDQMQDVVDELQRKREEEKEDVEKEQGNPGSNLTKSLKTIAST